MLPASSPVVHAPWPTGDPAADLVARVRRAAADSGIDLAPTLGSCEITRNMNAGFCARKVLRPGDTVTAGERTGTRVMTPPTPTVIALPTREAAAVSNGVFLESGPGVACTAADRSQEA